MSDYARLQNVVYLLKTYAGPGIPDKKAAEAFVEIESEEKLRPLRFQLQQIAEGSLDDEALDIHIGRDRKNRHGSYERWAKLMLQWLHVPKH